MTAITLAQSNLGTIVDDKYCVLKTDHNTCTYVFNLNVNVTNDSDRSFSKRTVIVQNVFQYI